MVFLVILMDFSINHYVWSFQRFTLSLARAGDSGRSTFDTQCLLTPIWMGALGWLKYATLASVIYLLWGRKAWVWMAGYLFSHLVGYAFLPLLPLTSHFSGIVRSQQLRNLLRP